MFIYLDGGWSRNVRTIFPKSTFIERILNFRIRSCLVTFLRLLGELHRIFVLRTIIGPLFQEITTHSLYSRIVYFCCSFHVCSHLLVVDCFEDYFWILLRISYNNKHYLRFRDTPQISQRKLLFVLWIKLAYGRIVYSFNCLFHLG